MNKQQVYDKTLAHLRKQGVPAGQIDEKGMFSCRYLDRDGNKCAIGCHVPDEAYSVEMEGRGVFHVDVASRLSFELDITKYSPDVRFLESLQKAHDRELKDHGLPAWETRMADIATDNGLVYTAP